MGFLPPYSETFAAARLVFAVNPTVDYTVPANRVAVIDSVTVVQDAGNAQSNGAASIDPTGSGSFVLFYAALLAAGSNVNNRLSGYWTGRVVVRAGGKIRIQTLASTTSYVTCSGFLLVA